MSYSMKTYFSNNHILAVKIQTASLSPLNGFTKSTEINIHEVFK